MDKLVQQAEIFAKKIVHTYFIERNFENILENIDKSSISWISTGAKDICTNIDDALKLFKLEKESSNLNFQIEKEKYHNIFISDNVVLVFGEITYKSNLKDKTLIKVPTRLTLLCKLINDKFKICHIHNSVADATQKHDDFFTESIGKYAYNVFQEIIEDKTIKLEHITNSIDGGVATISCDEFLSINYANDGFYKLIGYTREEFKNLMNNQVIKIINNKDLTKVRQQLLLNTSNNGIKAEIKLKKKSGEIIWILLSGHKFITDNNLPEFLCIIVDITESKQIQHALELERKRYKIIAEQSNNILFDYDIPTCKMVYSMKFTNITGKDYNIPNFVHETINSNLIYKKDLPKFLNLIKSLSSGKDFITTDLRINGLNNSYIWFKIQATVLFEDKTPIKAIGNIINIDKEKRENEALKLKARLDPLTKVYNKVVTKSLIENYITTVAKEKYHALMIIDIDNFKSVNDNLGHMFGDSVLSEVSSSIKKVFKESDIVGRIGGDEFIIFIKNISSYEVISQKANDLCTVFKSIYTGENNDFKISCSIGISIYPTHGITYDELFKKADKALYSSKSNGKNKFELYNPKLNSFNKNEDLLLNYYTENESYKRFSHGFENDFCNYVFDIMSETKDVNSAINLILDKIGFSFKLSRISILETSNNDMLLGTTYEWCDKNISPSKYVMQNLEFNDWKTYLINFHKNGNLNCSNIYTYNLPYELSKLYESLKSKSIFQSPILDNGKFKGCVCFDICYENHTWTDFEIQSFTSITKIISSYLLNMRTKELLENEKLLTEAVAKNQSLYTYMLKPNSYKLIYLSPNTQDLYPNARVGELCYKAIGNSAVPCKYCPLTDIYKKTIHSNTIEFYNNYLKGWISSTASEINLSLDHKANLICFSNVTNFIDRITSKDTLTGALTLAKFEVLAKNLLANTSYTKFALIYCDINKFKYINETSGYAIGNKVLAHFAHFISSFLFSGELICRASADNFIILLKYDNIESLKNRFKVFNEKFMEVQKMNFNNLKIPVICGIYLIDSEDTDLSLMIDRANIARKTIKGSHKSKYALYDHELHLKITKEKEIENLMFSSLENNEFLVYLQPKIDLPTQTIVGAEALVRWMSPSKKLIPPNEFIPLFEKNGFIIELDFYVYEEIFKKMNSWIQEGKKVIPISLNVSRSHINDSDFIPRLKKLTEKYDVPTNLIELELTESIFFDDIQVLLNAIIKLKALGFTCSIDDFGSGYSSLNLLKDLPIDVLKLDKEFFPNSSINSKEKVIISNIVKMAQDLNIIVISEGIETKEQADFLTEIGCDMAQGYLFDKPMPIKMFEKKLWG
ncbi:EAL domain-containing protein [Clostridium sp. M14]|uniref:bifunctional diguanylate cyclase/phosphodiesterase n=1 Tax=Clostridium sp. M14 TaxID=2716311 RepID=UPI0013EE9EAA|nr:EAL domain-containing protein [Clostridium sp. M14]MBZ9691980.1 EAL domain-containing protein [Clostridium sp. M14]